MPKAGIDLAQLIAALKAACTPAWTEHGHHANKSHEDPDFRTYRNGMEFAVEQLLDGLSIIEAAGVHAMLLAHWLSTDDEPSLEREALWYASTQLERLISYSGQSETAADVLGRVRFVGERVVDGTLPDDMMGPAFEAIQRDVSNMRMAAWVGKCKPSDGAA